MAMTLVQTVTLGSSAASIEFTNIAGTGKDLYLLISGRAAQANGNGFIYFNNDTTNGNYSGRLLEGDGSAVESRTMGDPRFLLNPSTYTADTFSSVAIYISNYTSSAAKSFSIDQAEEQNSSSAQMRINAVRWSGTDAITSIKLNGDTNIAAGTTASLYIIS